MSKNIIKKLKEENQALRDCLNSLATYQKKQHDAALKIAKDIVERDSKAVANIILNMDFGNERNVSFCEIFDLRERGGCNKNKRCTDCIHSFLKKYFQELKTESEGE